MEKNTLVKTTLKRIIVFICLFFLINNGQLIAAPWNFAVVADTRDNDGTPGVNALAVTAISTDIVSNRDAAFLLIPGDLIIGEYNNTYDRLTDQIQAFKNAATAGGLKPAGTAGAGLDYYAVRGNHETIVNGGYGSDDIAVWQGHFGTLPQNGPTTATGGGGNSEVGFTYSFTYNNALFIAVDQYVNAQNINQDWVDQQTANNTSQHVFAFGHEPAYQASHIGCLADDQAGRDDFLTSLYSAGGRLYFAGHDHSTAIARVYEKDPNDGGTQGFYQAILGGGGAPAVIFGGTYNKDYPADYAVADLYHDYDPKEGLSYYYTYAIVTVDDDLLWMKLYGTLSLAPVNWGLLSALVISGTLESDTSVLTSNIINDAELVFNQASDGTYSGVISGLGNLTKSGSAMLTLSGDNTYTGSTSVNSGTLAVTGDLSSSAVTVNSAGTLMGTGPIKSLMNNGITKPGNSVGILNLGGGAFTQGGSGTLEIEVDSNISFDTIVNVSTATLDGILRTITTGTYAIGTTLANVIETANGLVGSFSTLFTQITPTIVWKPNINGNNMDLVATREYNNDTLKLFLTTNGKNIASLMTAVLPAAAGDLGVIKTVIDNLTTNAEVARAYSEISPQKLNSLPSFAFSNTSQQIGNLQNQIHVLRTGLNYNTGYAKPDGAFSGSLYHGVLLAYDGDDWAKFVPKKDLPVTEKNNWRLSINGGVSYDDQDTTANQTGFECTSGGITMGLSYGLENNRVIGLHVGYTLSDSDITDSGGNVSVDTTNYGIYASSWNDDSYLTLSMSGSSNFYANERNIVFGGINRTATSDAFGQQLNSFIGYGYDFHFNKMDIGPTSTLQYSKIWIDGFSESGAGSLNMDLDDQRAESLQLGLGVRAVYNLEYKGKRIVPQTYISYQHEFSNDRRSIGARLKQGSDIFQVQTDKPDRDFALAGCGLTVQFTKTMSFNASYQALFAHDDYSSHSVGGSIDICF